MSFPGPHFRQLKVNNLELELCRNGHRADIRRSISVKGHFPIFLSGKTDMPDLGEFQGANAEALERALRHADKGCAIEAEAGAKGTARLVYEVNDDHPTLNRQLRITAGAGSDVTVYLVFEGGAAGGEVNFLHYIRAEAGAHVKIVKVQLHEAMSATSSTGMPKLPKAVPSNTSAPSWGQRKPSYITKRISCTMKAPLTAKAVFRQR